MILRTVFIAVISLLIFGRCAQVVAPTGGKKDSLAPILLQSYPPNRTINFKDNRVELLFDEYVIVDNLNQKLVITPEADNPYSYKLNGETVILNFKKEFEDSTTYTLNFGDGIKDYAEKNPAKNLKLVFSTGPKLDSGRVYGKVKDVKTNQPILDVLVGLYLPTDTLNPAKTKPYYFSRTDSSGIFSIENVQVKAYRLIAIEDKNRNMLYNAKDERIGFLKENIIGDADSTNYNLTMAISDNTPIRIQRTLPKVNNYTVVFNKGIEKARVSFETPDSLPHIRETNQIKFFNIEPHSDTVVVNLQVTDSLGTDSTFQQKIAFQQQRGKTPQKEPFTMATEPQNNKPLANEFSYSLKFNKPIAFLDADSIRLYTDSVTYIPLTDLKQTWNDYHNELKIEGNTKAIDSLKWQIPLGAVISVEQDTLPLTHLKHPVLDPEDYATLSGTVLNADSTTSVIIELLDEKYQVVKQTFQYPYHFIHIPEGKYYLRLTLDSNRNQKWDSGNLEKGLQPETVIFLPEKLHLKSNFEISGIDITVDNPQ
ncbi:Ig-like domain-containing protein [Dyadobacter jejuensis]|uniref:Ig-like domain-containing protein n=1 Tax=Dyadobacter jejuensis TaxID=1082580 RepID=A0A316ACV7_9BACT|nr:Ig-like domain-containing domain [Dyadobacter jejuensis]PWJ55239.1 Ig-like domain-containing protein [Dyadobacter jejuensis]